MCGTLMRRTACVILALFLLLAFTVPVFASPQIVYRHTGSSEKKRIALTFDDGPHPRYTPQILDILAEYGVEATFFTVGSNAEAYPAIVKRILSEGHELGNHTFNHPYRFRSEPRWTPRICWRRSALFRGRSMEGYTRNATCRPYPFNLRWYLATGICYAGNGVNP